jgi:hypothetical protein
MSEEDGRQRMETEDNNVLLPVDTAPGFVGKIADVVGMGAIGSYSGAAAAVVTLTFIGLSPVGPVAGGIFAANMGTGLISGGAMAVLQSAAMTGAFVAGGGYVGGATGAVVGHYTGGNATKTVTETAGRTYSSIANTGASLTASSYTAVVQSVGAFVTVGGYVRGATGAVVGHCTGGSVTKTVTETAKPT